jgi:hypothetical protein
MKKARNRTKMPAMIPHLMAYAIGLVHHQSDPRLSELTVLPFPLPPSRRASALRSSFIGDILYAGVRPFSLCREMRGVVQADRSVNQR